MCDNDGIMVEIPRHLLVYSKFFADALSGCKVSENHDENIFHIEMSSDTLKKILEYLQHHHENPTPKLDAFVVGSHDDGGDNDYDEPQGTLDDLTEYDKEFLKVPYPELANIANSSAFLNIPQLIILCAKTYAILLKNNPVEQWYDILQEPDDLKKEEKEAYAAEHKWAIS